MINWLLSLFKKKEVKLASLREKLSEIKSGDLVQVTLNSDFCDYAKTQPLMRFSLAELESRLIRGVVFFCQVRNDVKCYVVEIQTITTEYGDVRSKSVSILEDEIKDIKKYV